MLSNIHKEDITYLSRQVSSSSLTEYYSLKIGNEHGYKYAYMFLDLFVRPNKNRRDKIKENLYYYLRQIKEDLIQLWYGRV
jgi:hypothetical protein